jgi:tripartite-type tricarboxylate transporter receptor subunit TctC
MRTVPPFRAYTRAALLLFPAVALAQDFPTKPIRIVVPFTPGGATDVVTRIVAQKLSEQFARQVVTDNRGGAGGIVGVEVAAKAAPDGYTLVMGTSGTHAINVSLYPEAFVRSGQRLCTDYARVAAAQHDRGASVGACT